VQIVRGDDSWLFKPKSEQIAETNIDEQGIEGEEDLYKVNEAALLNEDIGFDDRNKRHIKPDNIVGGAYGTYQFVDNVSNQVIPAHQLFGSWAYQIDDNIWLEGAYGYNLISGFPDEGSQALVNNLMIRAKYTVKAPLYSFLQPYVGYQQYSVSCPTCGKATGITATRRSAELKNVADIEGQSGLVFGVTVLRRLVPGWFLKLDVGTDAINVGFAIEF
jgi:hypothetical protein